MSKNLLHHKVYLNGANADWLVFIHGAGGGIATWKYQIDAFEGKYNLLLMDLRDHGETQVEMVDEAYTFEIITDDILKVLEANGVKNAHFLTLSFGSVILQDLSLRYPDLVKSAIFAGGIFKPTKAIKSFVYLAKGFNVLLPYKWMYSLFSYLLMPKSHHQLSRKIYQKQAAKIDSAAYMRWLGLYSEFFELLHRYFYQNLSFPAMIIMGSEDYVFLKAAKDFVAIHKTAQLEIMPNAGHICNIDQYKQFNSLALSFIAQVSPELPTAQAQ